ncbi:serine hydrolase domain-containing protein [Flavobacterium piscisymbiosum]|uniref:Beta-lactamase family protein n=1 Tax=Flavobacterium piscisymbiosum TaxID=2893753 RepID=A0ABS8MJX4_9FLAO|nr:serine hydrolase [Flavobacterium sp. F-30]MCC9065182.1 beta-lactamase family protein [Flavobacterium sp. F-30]
MKNSYFFYIFLFLNIFHISGQTKNKIDDSLLREMTDSISSKHYPGIHSVLISKDKQLVYEQYFNGYKRDSLHDSRSSFKSIASLLVGIAIDKGFIKNINQKVYEFFPEYPYLKTDPLKKNMTIKNLLEMKSGFDCEEFNDTKDCEDEMSSSKNWVGYSLNLPMKDKPGEVWAYTSIDPVILSGVMRKATKMSVMDFAKKYLFEPLGITNYKWTIDPSGNGMTAGSFYIKPKDMLKIGQMVKDKGIWEGKQIISKKWILESTLCDILIPDFSYMKTSKSKIGSPQPAYYGYYWYRETLKTKDLEENLLFASGNGGQYIFIIENLNLTVVFTQGNYQSFKAKQAFEIMAKYILPQFKN